jgi:hypothetical protein
MPLLHNREAKVKIAQPLRWIKVPAAALPILCRERNEELLMARGSADDIQTGSGPVSRSEAILQVATLPVALTIGVVAML